MERRILWLYSSYGPYLLEKDDLPSDALRTAKLRFFSCLQNKWHVLEYASIVIVARVVVVVLFSKDVNLKS